MNKAYPWRSWPLAGPITDTAAAPDEVVAFGRMISPAARAMPIATSPETVPRINALISKDKPSARWSTQFRIHDRETVGTFHIVHFGYAQHAGKHFRGDFHRAG